MIKVTWLHFRGQALIAAAALAVIAIVLVVTGEIMHHLYSATVLGCHGSRECPAAVFAFRNEDHDLQIILNVLVAILPALIGLFWGAPLVAREFESGTYRLAWTQTTPTRWLAIKLAGSAWRAWLLRGP
jgi:hypothetical protein